MLTSMFPPPSRSDPLTLPSHSDSTHAPPSSVPIQAINEDGVTDGASSNAPQMTNPRTAALTGGNAGASGVHHSVSEIMRPHLQLLWVEASKGGDDEAEG